MNLPILHRRATCRLLRTEAQFSIALADIPDSAPPTRLAMPPTRTPTATATTLPASHRTFPEPDQQGNPSTRDPGILDRHHLHNKNLKAARLLAQGATQSTSAMVTPVPRSKVRLSTMLSFPPQRSRLCATLEVSNVAGLAESLSNDCKGGSLRSLVVRLSLSRTSARRG